MMTRYLQCDWTGRGGSESESGGGYPVTEAADGKKLFMYHAVLDHSLLQVSPMREASSANMRSLMVLESVVI